VKLAIAASFALVACGRSEVAVEPTSRPPADAATARSTLLGDARELITAVTADWTSTKVTLRRFRREGGSWKPVGSEWPGVIGKSGTAWGSGVHGTGAPAGRSGPIKREGDGKSPAGAFVLGASYGYAKSAPPGTRIPYTTVDDAWKCVDDPASKSYNRVLDRSTVDVDWKSAEDMRRADNLYAWVVDIAHNATRTPNGGSCIFFHVWGGADSSTLGCTAMDEQTLASLIEVLEPDATFVLLPKAEYEALAPAWGLPRSP